MKTLRSRYGRRRPRLAVGAGVLSAALLAPAGIAHAATPKWTSLGTSGQLDISDVVGTARTSDGALHVGWFTRRPNDTDDLFQTPVSATGTVGTPVPIVTGWAGIQGPTLLSTGNSLLAFWAGTQTTITGDPTTGLDAGVSADNGNTWSISPDAIVTSDYVYGRDTSVVLAPGGPLAAWYSIGDTVTHLGTDPSVADQTGFGTGRNQTLALSGSLGLVAWCTDVDAPDGVYVQPVNPADGSVAGAAVKMPGSTSQIAGTATSFCPSSGHVQLVARQDQGFFVAAVNGTRHVVEGWNVGAAAPITVGTSSGYAEAVASAASPGAKASVWVGWQDGDVIDLRRSNGKGTVFGATVTVPSPPGTLYGLDLNAQADRVDLVARVASLSGTVSLLHAQQFPGLTLEAQSGRTPSFKVLDAGDPVAGATISVGGHTATTNQNGVASISRLAPGRYTAQATKTKYVGASAGVTVPKPPVRHHR